MVPSVPFNFGLAAEKWTRTPVYSIDRSAFRQQNIRILVGRLQAPANHRNHATTIQKRLLRVCRGLGEVVSQEREQGIYKPGMTPPPLQSAQMSRKTHIEHRIMSTARGYAPP